MMNGGSSGSATSSNRVELDPRMNGILYGNGRTLKPGVKPIYGPSTESTKKWVWDGNGTPEGGVGHWEGSDGQQGEIINPESDYTTDNGLLGRITGLLDTPQKAGMANLGLQTDNFLNSDGFKTLQGSLGAATSLQNSNLGAPVRGAAAQVNAPNQNGIDLTGSYNDLIYGAPGANPYLTGAIQKGLNQANNNFGNLVTDATKATQGLLGNIRSGARVSGSYGGNREALAQGQALDSFNTNITRALSQVGQNGQDAAVAAQAGAYDTDRNRALAATQGLGAQQYGVASQNAQLAQQQQLANQQAELSTNQLNSANRQAGINASTGILGQMYGWGTNNDQYAGNKVGQVANMISPFTGLGSTQTQTSPLYQNSGAGILGGAVLGNQLAGGLNLGSIRTGNYNNTLGSNGWVNSSDLMY
jgi:hypothetical protein